MSGLPSIIAPAPRFVAGARRWREELVRIEDLGFDLLAISEHYTDGWTFEPMVTVAFAAAATSRLRIAPIVLNNDLRHPAIVAKAIATVDQLSDGRVSGIGAGWLARDYEALGLDQDRPGVRLSRLEDQ